MNLRVAYGLLILPLVCLCVIFGSGCKDYSQLQERNISFQDFQIDTSLKEVVVQTDKDVYSTDEYVYFIVYNGLNETITMRGESGCKARNFYLISELVNNKWSDLKQNCGGCDVSVSRTFKSGESIVVAWNQKLIQDCEDYDVRRGIYKVKLRYVLFPCGDYNNHTITPIVVEPESNVFEIQ